MPRIPFVDPAALPDQYEILDEEASALHEAIDVEWWNNAGTVRTFGNNPDLAKAHVMMNVSLWTRSGLSPAEVEYVILAVARALESEYEWHAHVIAGIERAGLTTDEILAISRRETDAMPASKRALVEYAFQFVREGGAVSDDRHAAVGEHYDDSTLVGIAMMAGYYMFIHHVTSALGLELEEQFVGWELDQYPL